MNHTPRFPLTAAGPGGVAPPQRGPRPVITLKRAGSEGPNADGGEEGQGSAKRSRVEVVRAVTSPR